MRVELDVFSGRPNPRWVLDEQQSRELTRLQARLTSTSTVTPDAPGLGYRGFVYSDSAGAVRAYRGYVQTQNAVLADPSFTIERFLIEHLPLSLAEWRESVSAELRPTKQ